VTPAASELPWIVHQSDLQSWVRCPRELYYDRTVVGSRRQNSGTAFGSVLHHAMHVLERDLDLDGAIKTFLYYWHPMNIEAICLPVSSGDWLPGHSYGELRKRGVDTLRKYADVLKYDDHELLALEYEFVVPLHGVRIQGRPVMIAGTMDRLAARWYRRRETLCVDDFKTGQQKWNLRHNVQGTVYIYATLQPEFWSSQEVVGQRILGAEPVRYVTKGFDAQEASMGPGAYEHRGLELHDRFNPPGSRRGPLPRKFTWINLKSFRWVDGGYRGPQDFQRMKEGVAEVLASSVAGIFPLRIDGETCRFCAFRKDPCGVPDDDHADPAYAIREAE
jgi:hypothetical protein